MSNPRHSELTGSNLHGTRIPTTGRNRPPAYEGELIFDQESFWVGTGNPLAWQSASAPPPPPFFGWAVDFSSYSPPEMSPLRLEAWYLSIPADEAPEWFDQFQLIKTWEVGTEWRFKAPVSLAPQVSAFGAGSYVLTLRGGGGYAGIRPATNVALTLANTNPLGALTFFEFTQDDFYGDNLTYPNTMGFEITNPMAQVTIRFGNR